MLLWLLPLLASAQDEAGPDEARNPVSVSFTEDLEVRYWTVDVRQPDNPDRAVFNYVEQVNRLNATATRDPWALGLQLDQVAYFANRHFLDDRLVVERQLVAPDTPNPVGQVFPDAYANLEKAWVRYRKGPVEAQVGDVYAAFGRGVALNLNRNVDIDIDTSIQGAKVVGRPGPWDLTAVIGQLNRQQVLQDNPNRDIFGDLRHGIGGMRAERFGLGPANIGAHVVAYDFVNQPGLAPSIEEAGSIDAVVGGGTFEANGVLGLDLSLEVDGFAYPTDVTFGGEPSQPGYAAYSSVTGYTGATTWQVEVKRYKEAERINRVLTAEFYEAVIAPTLEYERAITEDSSAAVNSNDIWGAKVRVDYSVRRGLVPYASMAVFRDEELGGLHFNRVPETIVHPMLGIEWVTEHGALLLNAGHRVDDRDRRLPGDVDQQTHMDATISFPIAWGWHGDLNLAGESYQWGINPLQQRDYVETENSFTASRGKLAFTWFTDVTTNPLVSSTGNLTDAVYGAGEVQVQPTSSWTIRAFYGAYKAGIRCSGGQCRLLPGFEGARASVTGTF